MTTIQVCHLDGRQFATNFIGEYGISPFDTWGWVVGCCEHEFECRGDDIDNRELEDGSEVITVRGEPVAKWSTFIGRAL